MTTTIQVSDKLGELIILVKSEHEVPEEAYADFASTLALIGNQAAESTLQRIDLALTKPATAAPAPTLAQAQATVQRTFPEAQVQPGAPAGPPMPSAATPACQHGQKVWKEGVSAKGPWKAWACPAASSDPTRCKFQFIRD